MDPQCNTGLGIPAVPTFIVYNMEHIDLHFTSELQDKDNGSSVITESRAVYAVVRGRPLLPQSLSVHKSKKSDYTLYVGSTCQQQLRYPRISASA